MKNMKLIMENFKKNMAEMFKGRELTDDELQKMDPKMRGFIEKSRKSRGDTSVALMTAVEAVRKEVLNMFDNQYSNIQDIVDDEATELSIGRLKIMCNRAFGDAYAQITGKPGLEASEEDMLKMFDALDVLEDDEQDGVMSSDMDDPPGYMPGEGGSY